MKIGEIRFENSIVPERFGIINSHRPVIIVGMGHGEAVQVVPLTTNMERQNDCCADYHVRIEATWRSSIALVEQVRAVPTNEIGCKVIAHCSAVELKQVRKALRALLELDEPTQICACANNEGSTAKPMPNIDTMALNLRMIAKLAFEAVKEFEK